MQAGVCAPFCRIHGIGPRETWYFSDETVEITREWLALRYRLIPYLQRQVREAMVSGLPVMRSMVLAFPEDQRTWNFELQYMFGDHLLVVPVLQPGGWVTVCLPEGVWYNYFTGDRIEGGQVFTVQMELEHIPIFVRQGAVIAEGPAVQHTGEINKENRIEKIRIFGYPEADSLHYEPDVSLIHEQASTRLTYKQGVVFEIYDMDYTTPEDGTLVMSL